MGEKRILTTALDRLLGQQSVMSEAANGKDKKRKGRGGHEEDKPKSVTKRARR